MTPPPRTVELGDHTIARIGLGTNRLTDSEPNREFVRAAAAAGIDHIDTAHLYTSGASESTIGAAFAGGEQPLIATKGGYDTNEPEALRAQIEDSFERLQSERIELYYLHRIKRDAPVAETMKLLRSYLDEGRIANVGLSDVTLGEIRAAREIVPVAAVQNEYNLGSREHDEVITYCEGEGIVFVPYFPLRGEKSESVLEVARRHDASANQIKLAWLLHRSPCVAPIPGTLSLEHLRENLGALEIELSPGELESLSA